MSGLFGPHGEHGDGPDDPRREAALHHVREILHPPGHGFIG